MMSLGEFNQMAEEKAAQELITCCGSIEWVRQMLASRPYSDLNTLKLRADEIWKSLSKSEWLAAFSHHPRIGDRAASARFAKDEQKGTATASEEILNELFKLNQEYEKIFGHVYLVFATGKSATEMLEILKKRIKNSPEDEIKNAVGEQSKITSLRLEKMFS